MVSRGAPFWLPAVVSEASPRARRRAPWAWTAIALSTLAVAGCAGRDSTSDPDELLHGRNPALPTTVRNPERMTDGICPVEGDPWDTDLAAVLPSGSMVLYDLGQERDIDALFLVGDNNDRFDIRISKDGKTFQALWMAPAVGGAGMRARQVRGLGARGRYLRVIGRGGDLHVSIGELRAWSKTPAQWPPAPERRAGRPAFAGARDALLAFSAALCAFIALCDRRLPGWLVALFAVPALVLVAPAVRPYLDHWPVPEELLTALRAAIAAVALLAALRSAFGSARRRILIGVLGLLVPFAAGAFLNMGHGWFYDNIKHRPTFVHTFDMRVYFPVAKYFDELRFDGLYLASVKAFLDGTGASEQSVADVEMRDLSTNHMVHARDVMDGIRTIDQRFSPERWSAFVEDMRYFWQMMGRRDYLGTLRDHGGNATPAWLAVAHLLFAGTKASTGTLVATGLLDPLLLLITFVAIWRTFGVRTVLLCMIVFGATDFPMLGSNWAGSTLRFDWMAGAGLAVCALARERYLTAGVLLAYAAMMRAFPATALMLVFAPLVYRRVATARAEHSWPSLAALARGPEARLALGTVACAGLLFVLSVSLFGVRPAWGGWLEKIEMHAEKPNTNHVGLRTVMSHDPELTARRLFRRNDPEPWTSWQQAQRATYADRAVWTWLFRLAFLAAAIWAAMRSPPAQAALYGLLLIPFLFYPANYYCHFVFLLPMLDGRERLGRIPWAAIVVLALSFAQYFTYLGTWSDERFYYQSVQLVIAFSVLCALRALPAPGIRQAVR